MHRNRLFILTFLLFWLMPKTADSQTFRCDGSLLLSTSQGFGFTLTNKVNFGPFGTINYGQVSVFREGLVDAMGFNSIDNFIYAVRSGTNEIVRLKADGSVETIGSVPSVDMLYSGAGDCTPDGRFLCYDYRLGQILVFEVVDEFMLVERIDLSWDDNSDNNGPCNTRFDDFAIDPTQPTVAYTFQGDYNDEDLKPDETRGYLHRINLDPSSPGYGKVTPIAKVPAEVIRLIGSLFFDAGGALFGYGSNTRGFNLFQNKLIRINKITGQMTLFPTNGPTGAFSDGCSCPYNVYFGLNVTPRDALCTNSEVTFTLNISNGYYEGLPNLSLVDTLPEGMFIKAIGGTFSGTIDPETGVGTDILKIDGMDIPPRGAAEIVITAQVVDIGIDLIENQAFLSNLPERAGFEMASDDPSTMGFVGDPSRFFATPQRLNSFDVEITDATDCLVADDASILVSAPVLIVGEEYQVNIRNEDFGVSSYQVIINEFNAFLLEDVEPGTYELFQIAPENSNCGFAMKDTTLTVEAPNELLDASAMSNSPICEGSPLRLDATMSPQGTVRWRGPRDWKDIREDLVLTDTDTTQAGIYEMIANYGFCEQVRTLEVEINPDIEARLTYEPEYCEGTAVQLIAEGRGMIQSVKWELPNGGVDDVLVHELPSAQIDQSGEYVVILDNGACADTAFANITINPSPKIDLPSVIQSSFCDPLVLQPDIDAGGDLQYSWTPGELLSCNDCPNPELLLPVQPRYGLHVQNEFGCTDSTEVAVELLKDRLIYIPNVFSPNQDGQNDSFDVNPACGIAEIRSFEIFNRWGVRVYNEGPFRNEGEVEPWDGTLNGKPADTGVYFYILKGSLVDGKRLQISGDVTLLR